MLPINLVFCVNVIEVRSIHIHRIHTDSSPVLLFLAPSYPPAGRGWLLAGDNLSQDPSADHQYQLRHIPHMDEYECDKQTKMFNTTIIIQHCL